MIISVVIPFRLDYDVEDWCLVNLNNNGHLRVTCDVNLTQKIQTFVFEDEVDAMAFKLRWL